LKDLATAVPAAIENCQTEMEHTTVTFEDDLKRGKGGEDSGDEGGDDADDASGN
jgi:hypothetical protein